MFTVAPKPFPTPRHTPRDGRTLDDFRRDRMIGTLVIVILMALIALMIWLASIDGSVPVNGYYDYYG